MAIRSPLEHRLLPVAGWYPDPYGRADLRWWDGSRWSDKASTGRALGSSPVGFPMPPPTQLPAPTLPHAPRRRGLVVGVVAAFLFLLVAIAIASSRGVAERAHINGQNPTNTESPAARCVARSLADDDRLGNDANARHARYRSTSVEGDKSYLDYGQALVAVSLDGCPTAYQLRFRDYANAWIAYGQWASEHTGLSHALSGSDRTGMRARQQAIVDANDALMVEVRRVRPDLARTVSFPST